MAVLTQEDQRRMEIIMNDPHLREVRIMQMKTPDKFYKYNKLIFGVISTAKDIALRTAINCRRIRRFEGSTYYEVFSKTLPLSVFKDKRYSIVEIQWGFFYYREL